MNLQDSTPNHIGGAMGSDKSPKFLEFNNTWPIRILGAIAAMAGLTSNANAENIPTPSKLGLDNESGKPGLKNLTAKHSFKFLEQLKFYSAHPQQLSGAELEDLRSAFGHLPTPIEAKKIIQKLLTEQSPRRTLGVDPEGAMSFKEGRPD